MTQTIAVQLRYQTPGSAAAKDLLIAATQDQLDRALAALSGEPEPQAPTKLPYRAANLVDLLGQLQTALAECEAVYTRENIANPCPGPGPGSHCCAVVKLSVLRDLGSSPKQMALILGCHAGFFDGEDPEVQFASRRFQPTPGFFDMGVQG